MCLDVYWLALLRVHLGGQLLIHPHYTHVPAWERWRIPNAIRRLHKVSLGSDLPQAVCGGIRDNRDVAVTSRCQGTLITHTEA